MSMDHEQIDAEGIAELYATGRLPPDDEEDFELHLLECRECRERVAAADDLRDGLRTIAAQGAAEAVSRQAVQLGLLGWLARRSRAGQLGLLACLLLILLALPTWLLLDRARLTRELEMARKPAEPPVEHPVPRTGEGSAETARLAAERSRLEEELRQERSARETLAGRLAALTRPQINTALYSLGLVRGEADTNEIELGPAPEWIVLSLELPAVEHDTYRATLLDAKDAAVWRGDGLHPTPSDTLTLLLYSDLLRPGAYRVRLEGAKGKGPGAPVGEISFRVR